MAIQEITNLVINKGTDFSVSFNIDKFNGEPLSLYGYTAVSKIRKYPSASFYKSFQASVTPETGTIFLFMGKADTIQLKTGRNYFDVLIINELETLKICKGSIMVEETASL
jgi:hypothetical protein